MLVIGTMVSEYPARSHTFIRREIEAVEACGYQVKRYSQRKFKLSEILNEQDRAEYDATWSVHPLPLLSLLQAHWQALMSSPANYFSVLVWLLTRPASGFKSQFYKGFYFIQAIPFARQLLADGIGILHIHFVNSGVFIGAAAARFAGIPWGATVHGRSDFDYPGVEALRWVLDEGHFLRCISKFGRSQAMRQTSRKNWGKIFVNYCGLPTSAFPSADWLEKKPGISAVPNILTVGRLSTEKGQAQLLELAALLKAERMAFTIKLIGDGPDRNYLQSLARELDVVDVCEFVGAVAEQDVIKHLASADIFVCSSLMEGLPQVLMEAMACGVPVVAPILSGIPELVEDKISGMLFPAADMAAMAYAVKWLINHPDECLAMRRKAREVVEHAFALNQTAVELAARLREEAA